MAGVPCNTSLIFVDDDTPACPAILVPSAIVICPPTPT